eukprot:scaffold1398_cov259-Pinguiococcus_pyrenoidosus.AAC.5
MSPRSSKNDSVRSHLRLQTRYAAVALALKWARPDAVSILRQDDVHRDSVVVPESIAESRNLFDVFHHGRAVGGVICPGVGNCTSANVADTARQDDNTGRRLFNLVEPQQTACIRESSAQCPALSRLPPRREPAEGAAHGLCSHPKGRYVLSLLQQIRGSQVLQVDDTVNPKNRGSSADESERLTGLPSPSRCKLTAAPKLMRPICSSSGSLAAALSALSIAAPACLRQES